MLLQAVELDPRDADSMHAVGAIHARKGNAELAARAYAHAVEMDGNHALALQDLGVARFREQETDAAKLLLERAVAADPALWRAHNVLGVIADERGDHHGAARHYSAALALRPGTASILNNRGYSNYMAGNFDSAEADLLAAVAADPRYGRAWHNLGLLYARQRRYGFALSALSNVMARYVAANDVGYVAMQDGDYDAASMLFEEAIRLSPRYYAMAEQNFAELRTRRGGDAVLSIER
jgi:Flp pilus assembly protein TadD